MIKIETTSFPDLIRVNNKAIHLPGGEVLEIPKMEGEPILTDQEIKATMDFINSGKKVKSSIVNDK